MSFVFLVLYKIEINQHFSNVVKKKLLQFNHVIIYSVSWTRIKPLKPLKWVLPIAAFTWSYKHFIPNVQLNLLQLQLSQDTISRSCFSAMES